MTTTLTARAPHETVWALATAITSTRSLQVVADLGVADRIDDAPVPVPELSAQSGADADTLERMLRLLAAHDIFAVDEHGISHTHASLLLRTDHPMSMRAFVRMMGLPVFSGSFAALDATTRSGEPALHQVEPNGLWAYFQDHPDEARVFDEAMIAKARGDITAVLASYDFGQFHTVADIGGGRGHLLRAVVDAVPTIKGVLFELPNVIESLAGEVGQITFHPGDFFVDPLPASDAYVLMEVIHDWTDSEATAILRAIRRPAAAGATLLIIEGLIPEDEIDPRVHALDVIMLAITGGRERTASQLADLLTGADFRLARVIETAGPMRIVEAVAV